MIFKIALKKIFIGSILGAAILLSWGISTQGLVPADAVDDVADTPKNTPVSISVLANDSGDPPLTIVSVSDPPNGTAAINAIDSSKIDYTPDLGFVGDDSFAYTIQDVNLNQDTATVRVSVTDPDVTLSATKIDMPDPVDAGGQVTYEVTVTNNGTNDATLVTMTDSLPGGFTAATITPPLGDSCSGLGTGTVDCDLSSISAGLSKVVTIVADVDPGVEASPPDLTNTATADSNDTVPVTGTATTTVSESASLTLSKTGPTTADAGTQITYDISVGSSGPSDVDNVALSDSVSAGLLIDSVSSPDCTVAANMLSVSCNWAHIDPSSPESFTITATIDPGAGSGATVTNTASADSDEPGIPADQIVSTTVTTTADLTVEKSDDPDPVIAGNSLTYSISVANFGPSDANDVEVTDDLPSAVTFVSADPGCSFAGGKVTCTLASLAAGAGFDWQVMVTVDKAGGTFGDGSVITNDAGVKSGDPDPVAINDDFSETTTVSAPVIVLTKTATPDSGTELSPGEVVTYTIAYENTGSAPATGFVITDKVDPLLGEVMPGDPGIFDPDTRVITWTLPDPVGPAGSPSATGSVMFKARLGAISSDRTINDSAGATMFELADPVESNTTATRARRPDVVITKSGTPAENTEVKPFDVITYRITVRNRGAGDALGVVVTDAPPPYMTYRPGTTALDGAPVPDSGGTSPLFGGGVSLGTLGPGDSDELTLQMTVDTRAVAGALLENWGYAVWNAGTQLSGDFMDLRVLRPASGPTLRQSILVQGPTGRTIFITVFNQVLSLLPSTGYEMGLFALLALASLGFGRALSMRSASELFKDRR